jgi:glutamate-1-semialdehyde 2,1-aminomutase
VSSQFRRGVTQVPRFYERAEGHYHFDVDGNKLLDYGLAFGPLILGSNHPAINAAVARKVTQLYGIGAGHEDEVKLARLFTEVLGVDNVLFSNTGTEAVQTAIKLARATTGRSKIVKFEGHYHGWANNMLVSVHQPAGGDEIAAVICEPINGNSGCLMPADGFLAGMVKLCAQFGAKSIFDEVITGFRIALGGAREFFGVIPDLSTHAKAMAGGFTMSAVAGKKEMFDCLRNVCACL